MRAHLALIAASALVAGCGAGTATDPGNTSGVFLAVASDFADFRSWESNTIDAAAGSSVHVAGRRTVYINERPPAGTTEFPVGTLIVKVTETDGKIFARAKRGGDFNRSGALNWEWFELEEGTAGLSVRWHGWGPPAGEMYGGDAGGACNGCHLAGAANDYVMTPWLMLTPAPGTDASDAAN